MHYKLGEDKQRIQEAIIEKKKYWHIYYKKFNIKVQQKNKRWMVKNKVYWNIWRKQWRLERKLKGLEVD